MMAFDKNGNIFVTDVNNHRIQKVILTRNSCGMYIFMSEVNKHFVLIPKNILFDFDVEMSPKNQMYISILIE